MAIKAMVTREKKQGKGYKITKLLAVIMAKYNRIGKGI